ncbi:DMT family transporter [Lactiplantibacillus fabifermentans]|uniref:Integral membrane protein n=1 Tax=Lactiplantibacillus fabifermentans DSM 21115 TaxID=1413187 RepID=A0A0R2NKU3_9LACO|nr:DMT family transporter [Lactiplantibacillus fabifermentans]KRO26360.1 hypothetical protein DY78_GL001054 [Lactiplantibacillus fabifermentans DSM 21115]
MLIFSIIPVIMGAGVAMQTAVNSRLGSYTKSPYLASAISFLVGAVFLSLILLVNQTSFGIALTTITSNPWWLWTVGLTGAFALTVNVLLFPRLGSIQTAVLPIVGQIAMGVLIDQFGWFSSPVAQLTVFKAVGLGLVVLGMFLAVIWSNRHRVTTNTATPHKLWWQGLGIIAGLTFGVQTAINGRVGIVLQSPAKAALVAFVEGALILGLLTLVLRVPVGLRLKNVGQGLRQSWWLLLGGILGGTYILLSAWLVPQIGTGTVVVISLFGQLLFSAVIDQLGLFKATKLPINGTKVLGLVVMLAGVILVRFI